MEAQAGSRDKKNDDGAVTRAELARIVHRKIGLSASEINCLINDFFDRVAHRIVKGEQVKLSSFGTFLVKSRAPRPARNPKTNHPAQVPARRAVLFRPATALRRRVASRPDKRH